MTTQTPDAVRETVAEATVITISVKKDGSTSFHSNIPPGQNWLDTLAAMQHGFMEYQRQFEESHKCPAKPVALDNRAGDAGEEVAANRVIYLLQGDNSRMAEALRSCRDQFAFYASEHTAAGKSEKAATNARFAKIADDALTAIKPAIPAPAVDAVPAGEVLALRVDWNRSELADAYDIVEGLRHQIAQPAESPLNQSLLTVMDALEAADVEWSGITKPNRSSEA